MPRPRGGDRSQRCWQVHHDQGCTCHLSTFKSLGTAVLCKHLILGSILSFFWGGQNPILTFGLCFHTDKSVCLRDWGNISSLASLVTPVTPVRHFAPSVRPWWASCLSLANRLFGSIQTSGPHYFHPLQKLDNGCTMIKDEVGDLSLGMQLQGFAKAMISMIRCGFE